MEKSKKPSSLQAILALAFVLFFVGIWWGLPSFRGWAPDEIVPSRVLDGLERLFSNGWFDRYPPFHYYLLGLLYAPFYLLYKLGALDFDQLPSYTALFYLARLVSVAMATATIYFVYKCSREILDRRSSLLAAFISALAVPFAFYAKLANLDIPYIFWFVVSMFFYLRILKTHQPKYYWLFTAAAVLAVCTKDQAYGLYILSPLPVFLSDWKYKKETGKKISIFRALLDRNYVTALLIGAGLFFVIHNIAFNARGFVNHIKLIVGPASKGYQIYPNTFSGQAHLLGQILRHIQFSFGWPLLLACAAGLLIAALRAKKNKLLLTLLVFAVSYHIFYSAVILYNYDRFNMPICIILSLFGGQALSAAWGHGRKFFALKSSLVGLLFLYSFLYAFSVDILMATDSRYSIERWMKANIPKQASIGVATPVEYCPRLEGLRWSHLPLSLPAFQKSPQPDYVLFNTAYSREFAKKTKEYAFFSRFAAGGARYKLVLRRKTDHPWLPLRTRNVLTNIDTINPEIQIFKKIARGTSGS